MQVSLFYRCVKRFHNLLKIRVTKWRYGNLHTGILGSCDELLREGSFNMKTREMQCPYIIHRSCDGSGTRIWLSLLEQI